MEKEVKIDDTVLSGFRIVMMSSPVVKKGEAIMMLNEADYEKIKESQKKIIK